MSTLAEASIAAANRNAEQTKTVYELALGVVALLGGALAFFGFTSLKSLKADAEQRATKAISGVVEQLQNEFVALTQDARDVANNAKEVVLRTGEACRNFSLWEFSNYEGSKKNYLIDAIQAISKARVAAVAVNDRKHEAWTYSFEALCRKDLGEFTFAIECLEKSIACYEREVDDPSLDYNMACYCCLGGQDERAAIHLRRAIEMDGRLGGTLQSDAKSDEDFQPWRDRSVYEDLVGSSVQA